MHPEEPSGRSGEWARPLPWVALVRVLQRIRHKCEPTTVRRPAVDVDGSLPAEKREAPHDLAPVCGANQPHLHIQVGRMPECARRKADIARKFAVLRQVREPVNRLRLNQTLNAAAFGGRAGQLRVARAAGELLGVEIQPGAVGRILRAIEMPAAGLGIARLASGRR
jgi:hypothetical protein